MRPLRRGRYHASMTREELARAIAEIAVLRGQFTLRSGRTSSYYLDKYLFSTQPEVLAGLGRLFAEAVARLPRPVARLAGAELGGVPLVCAASLATGLPCLFIRNERKGYGTARQLEGRLEPGEEVVLVEDIATTGGQVLEAAKVIAENGGRVVRIIAAIDREEGARENIEAAGYPFEALFTVTELGIQGG